MKDKKDIRKLKKEELQEFLIENGYAIFRQKQIDHWLWKKHVDTFEKMNNIHDLTFHQLILMLKKKKKKRQV